MFQDTIPFTVQELSWKHDTSKYYLVKNPQIYVSLLPCPQKPSLETIRVKDKSPVSINNQALGHE
jgi:hypothetical protein